MIIANAVAAVFSTPPDVIAFLPRCPMPRLVSVQYFLLCTSPVIGLTAFAARRCDWPRRIALTYAISQTTALIWGLFKQSYDQSPYVLGTLIVVAVWIGLLTYVIGAEQIANTSTPGTLLRRGARWVYSRQTATVFEALIGDMRFEYDEARESGQTWKAEWIRIRGFGNFVSTALDQISPWLIRLFKVLGGVLITWIVRRYWFF